jgi:hypothetical protein
VHWGKGIRLVICALLLGVAFAAITYGSWMLSPGAGWIVGGVMGVVWTALFVVDFATPDEPGSGGR